jgi:sporulation protein YlmC with PRC-barrel domain
LKGAPSGAAIAGGKASALAGNVVAAKSATGTQTAVATKPDEIRTWSDKTGKYKIEAQLVTKVDDKVILKRLDNGEIITLVIDKLSTADQEFLKANATGTKP